jgi:hypothetical protein
MHNRTALREVFLAGLMAGELALLAYAQEPTTNPATGGSPPDAVAEAQLCKEVPGERPEQKKTAHDLSDIFSPSKALPTTKALANQTDQGQMLGFDLYRDPVGALRPGMTFEELHTSLVAAKPQIMATQRKLLESRYRLEPKFDPVATMSRGKPLPVGPTAKLPQGSDWTTLGASSPDEIRRQDAFPYKALPHPAQGGGLGGQVFPRMQIKMFPRLERYDVEHDLPEAFLPEFPPAMFLQNRPELPTICGHSDACAARWLAPAGDAVPAGRI